MTKQEMLKKVNDRLKGIGAELKEHKDKWYIFETEDIENTKIVFNTFIEALKEAIDKLSYIWEDEYGAWLEDKKQEDMQWLDTLFNEADKYLKENKGEQNE